MVNNACVHWVSLTPGSKPLEKQRGGKVVKYHRGTLLFIFSIRHLRRAWYWIYQNFYSLRCLAISETSPANLQVIERQLLINWELMEELIEETDVVEPHF